MRNIQIYIVGQRLELFNDEKITINSSIQNVYDIAKVFTDYSQGFTVPATPHNNAIFQHFYQSDVDANLNLFDYRTRQPAKIEIETIPFKIGKIQLEKANLKNGQVESYTITFYGEIVTLKDTFQEDKLNVLDFTPLEQAYSGGFVQALITTSTNIQPVMYPLITSNNVWTYNDGSTTDIKNNLEVRWDELFPAVRLSEIFNIIQSHYNITFQSAFLSDERFTNAFLYFKNRDQYIKKTNKYKHDGQTISNNYINSGIYNYQSQFSGDRLFISKKNLNQNAFAVHKVLLTLINTSFAIAPVTVEVWKNGNFLKDVVFLNDEFTAGSGTVSKELINEPDLGTSTDFYEFYYSSNTNTGLDFAVLVYTVEALDFVGSTATILIQQASKSTDTGILFQVETSLYDVCPDIKVADLFTGILKEFNLVCYGISQDVYQIEPLDVWYQKGAIIDITKYLVTDNIDVERVNLFKRIAFKYKESKSFINRAFKKLFEREYGNVEQDYLYDGQEYNIEVPFENLLFQKFTGTNLQVGYTLEEAPDYKPYTPQPIILYRYGVKSCDFKFNNGVSTTITQYNAFGQDLVYNGYNYTLNFNAEISTLLDSIVTNTIFSVYYQGYIDNLYNEKNRIYKLQTLLPISILTGLRLNDRLIIRDKRYIINNMQSDLTTGEVNLELINDFRPTLADGGNFPVSPLAGCYILPILLGNSYVSATLSTTVVGVTITPSTITEDTNVQICIPDKLDKQEIRDTEISDQRITEDGDIRVTEDGYPQLIPINILYTGVNGTLTTDLTLIQI